jgi:hypothetical protein
MSEAINIFKSIMRLTLLASVGFAALLYGVSPALAATAPPLGVVQQFGALGGSGVTGSAGAGVIVDGDVGSSPTATIINFPPSSVTPGFTLHMTNDGVVQQARVDATIAALNLASQGPGTVLPAQLDGQILTAGSYSFTSTADLAASGTLTLNGPGVFVFNVNTALTANVLSNVTGTADPCNVFWRVGTSATLNGNNFFGTVIAATGFVTVGTSANVTGRVVAATAITMAGAGGNTIGGCSSTPITLSPEPPLPTGTVGVVYNELITATGGDGPPYTCSVTSGALPDGLMISSGGLISGTPTNPGTFPFTVTCIDDNDNEGQQDYVIVINPNDICPPITLSPAPPLPTGTVGVVYDELITATGGDGPYTFSGVSGLLPNGLVLTSGGLITGTPTLPGAFPFSVTATDVNGCTGLQAYVIVINPNDICLSITLSPAPPLPTGTVGVVYDELITATGGDGPYIFSLSNGLLPNGLMLASDGLISGTPTNPGTFPFSVMATDVNGCTGVQDYVIVVNPADCPFINLLPSPPLPLGTVGIVYDELITATGGDGPYTFSVVTGALPDGLMISSDGLISGTPTNPGTFPFSVTATDVNGCTGLQAYTIVITTVVPDANKPIPTLSEWGLIAMAGILGIVGLIVMRRRKIVS